jgi:NAD+ diphosphatase
MFQDTGNHMLHNNYLHTFPKETDYILIYNDGQLLLSQENDKISIPTVSEFVSHGFSVSDARYLVGMDDCSFYMTDKFTEPFGNYSFIPSAALRRLEPSWLCFGAATAMHLLQWYTNNQYCGRCSTKYEDKEDERALICPSCGQILYPMISPAIIVGVTDGDSILLTRYSQKHGSTNHYALVAGFVEIGETLEDTIRREVMEETGITVENIRYYNSQPWAFSNSILMGFFADASGEKVPVPDGDELSEAIWVNRSDIGDDYSSFSLTGTMIKAFKDGKIPV